MKKFSLSIVLFLGALVAFVAMTPSRLSAQEVPEGFQKLLPRGGIPAIDKPTYVSADKARISDKAFVFGVVIEGQAVAYSLNLLNSHEIVNDTIGKTNFAAVW